MLITGRNLLNSWLFSSSMYLASAALDGLAATHLKEHVVIALVSHLLTDLFLVLSLFISNKLFFFKDQLFLSLLFLVFLDMLFEFENTDGSWNLVFWDELRINPPCRVVIGLESMCEIVPNFHKIL